MLSSILDYRNMHEVFFNLLLQRLGKLHDRFDRNWAYDKLWGPEHRVVNNFSDTIALRDGDRIVVDVVCSRDIYSLLNVAEEDWNQIPDYKLKERVKANPAMTVFGGGGYAIAIDEKNNDSILYNSQGLRRDPFDYGKDQSFNMYSFNLPDTLAHDNMGFLRLRVRVVAKNDGEIGIVEDDADDFFVEGLGTTLDCGCGEIYTNSITINNKYSVVPQEHAVFPISMEITNTANSFPHLWAIVKIKQKEADCWQWADTTLIPDMQRLEKKKVDFRKVDLSYFKGIKKGKNDFQAVGYNTIYAGDHIMENDSVYTEFSVNIGDVIAYDDDEAKSEVGEMFYIPDRGLNLCGHSSAEYTQTTACGEAGGDCVGMYAMKFQLARRDTLYGASGCFMPSNYSPDEISYVLYKDTVINYFAHLPGQLLSKSEIKTVRGIDNIRKDLYFGEYVTCLFDEPIIIEYGGTYWLAIKQKAQSGLELGGSGQGMGMIITSYSSYKDYTPVSIPISLMLDRKYRSIIYGSLINDNVFAYRNDTSETAEWQPFMPNFGYPAYGFLDSAGTKENIKTYSRGTWIPMIRPYFNGDHYNWNSITKDDYDEIISIYPNPAKDHIIIEYPNANINYPLIKFLDINGRELHPKIEHFSDRALIDTRDQSAGIYIVKVIFADKVIVKKLMKN